MILEQAKKGAIKLLASLPPDQPDAELSIRNVEDQLVWLGMGWLIGRGLAVYRGDHHFRFAAGMRDLTVKLLDD